jgi:hypothetical protein
MCSDVSLAVCGDLPQGRGGPERQVARKFSHFHQWTDSRRVARNVAICREFGANWLINGA